MINSLDRIEGLMSGKLKPQDQYEDLFMIGVTEALSARRLLNKYVEIFQDLDEDILLLHSFCMGYALGQQRLEQEVADFNNDDGDNSNH